jgi:hypothetical protein
MSTAWTLSPTEASRSAWEVVVVGAGPAGAPRQVPLALFQTMLRGSFGGACWPGRTVGHKP